VKFTTLLVRGINFVSHTTYPIKHMLQALAYIVDHALIFFHLNNLRPEDYFMTLTSMS
jgi:hypothetical protein